MNLKNSENGLLNAGAAQIDITPTKGSLIGVDFFSHYARFINDPLFSKALVLQQENNTFAFVMVDICIIPSDLLNTIKQGITAETNIAKEHILLACTHTHGAGDVAGLLGGAVDIAYRNLLPARIVRSVVEALRNMRPAKIASGHSEVTGYQACRRYFMKEEFTALNPISQKTDVVKTNPFGAEDNIIDEVSPVDPEMNFVAIKGLDDSWISVLANYSTHYAGDWDVDTITADFYGTFAKYLSEELGHPKHFVAIMSYGTGADVNTWDFKNLNSFTKTQFSKTKEMGKDLAEGVLKNLDGLIWSEHADLRIAYEEIALNIRKPSKEELDRSEKLLAEQGFENLSIDHHGLSMIYAREQLLLNEYPDTHTAAIQAIKIGNQLIGALGGEIFSETGLWLKAQFPNTNYFTICLANTYDGYVPPTKELARGGYETWRARSSFLDGHAEEKLRSTLKKLVDKIQPRC